MSGRHFLIDWHQLKPQIPYCRQTIGRMEKKGTFPIRVRIGERRIGWWQNEIDAWLASRQRGGPAQYVQLGPRPPRPEPEPEEIALLRQIAAKHGLELVTHGERRKRRSGRGP